MGGIAMSYQEELNRLQDIITSAASSDQQREQARRARKTLIDGSIDEAFAAFEMRTEDYNQLIGRLRGIIDNIAGNRLTSVIEDLDGLAKDIKKAAGGS